MRRVAMLVCRPIRTWASRAARPDGSVYTQGKGGGSPRTWSVSPRECRYCWSAKDFPVLCCLNVCLNIVYNKRIKWLLLPSRLLFFSKERVSGVLGECVLCFISLHCWEAAPLAVLFPGGPSSTSSSGPDKEVSHTDQGRERAAPPGQRKLRAGRETGLLGSLLGSSLGAPGSRAFRGRCHSGISLSSLCPECGGPACAPGWT